MKILSINFWLHKLPQGQEKPCCYDNFAHTYVRHEHNYAVLVETRSEIWNTCTFTWSRHQNIKGMFLGLGRWLQAFLVQWNSYRDLQISCINLSDSCRVFQLSQLETNHVSLPGYIHISCYIEIWADVCSCFGEWVSLIILDFSLNLVLRQSPFFYWLVACQLTPLPPPKKKIKN